MMLAHQDFVKKIDAIPNDEEKADFLKNYRKSRDLESINEKLQPIHDETEISFNDSIFKIHKSILPKEILEQLSIDVGENIDFKKGKIVYFPSLIR